MATLAERDTTGTLIAAEGEIELPYRRTRNAKVFHLGGRRYRIGGSLTSVHYRRDPFDESEGLKEIDLSLEPTPGEEWDFACETNGYQVRVWNSRQVGDRTLRCVAQFRRAGRWFEMAPVALAWMNEAGERELISKPAASVPAIEQEPDRVLWRDAFGAGLDFCYTLTPDHFWKAVIVRDKAALTPPTIGRDGLRLVVVMSVAWEGGARAGNGFADGIEIALDDDEGVLDVADEDLAEPGEFDYRDAAERPLWWMRRPRAWDSSEDRQEFGMGCRLRRRGGSVRMLLALDARAVTGASTVYPLWIDTSISEEQVGASEDDARERGATHPGSDYFYLTSTTHFFGASTAQFFCDGMRFQSIPIPQGSTIDSASIKVKCETDSAYPIDVYINAEDVDDGDAWSSSHKPSGAYASRTTASSRWSTSAAWAKDGWYQSPDLSAVVEEVVGRAGWAANADLSFVTTNRATTLPAANTWRRIYSYDSGAANAAKFNCSYTEPPPAGGDWLFASD